MKVNDGDIYLSSIGSLLGDDRRARIVMALMSGRALAASTLASEAGIANSTASEHLTRLVDGGLLIQLRQGRHRYYKLSGPKVAKAVEALASIAPPAPIKSLDEGTKAHALRFARSCYDHLAGKLGVELLDSMVWSGLLTKTDEIEPTLHHPDPPVLGAGGEYHYDLTADGQQTLKIVGVSLGQSKRPLTRYCIDWSEQRPHLGGKLGAALFERSLELGWVRRNGTGRALLVTPEGREAFQTHFGVARSALTLQPYERR